MFDRYPLFQPGDEVRITDGPFEDFEARVLEMHHASGQVTVEIAIFGKQTPVDLEWWQIEHRDD